jgi:peptide/nickel transport system ATP-binding protein
MESIIKVNNLQISIAKSKKKLVKGLDLCISPGETVALVGESGSGKSLTALSIMRLLHPNLKHDEGEILLRNDDSAVDLLKMTDKEMQDVRGRRIGMIFQEPMSAFSPVRTIGDQVGEPLVCHNGCSRKKARDVVAEILAQVGIVDADRAVRQYPFEFSGGMLQRAMIARAIICHPELIIADEPTTALDVTVQAQVLNLLKSVQMKSESAMLFITHDLAVARQMADRIIVMRHGLMVEEGSAKEILTTPQSGYSKMLLSSVPRFLPDAESQERPEREVVVSIDKVSLSYPGSRPLFGAKTPPKRVLTDISATISRGSVVGLVGESGSGKTTLARSVLNLVTPQAGQIEFHSTSGKDFVPNKLGGKSLRGYWRHAQMVFQNPYASLNPWHSIMEILTEPVLRHGIASGEDAKEIARTTIEKCGLDASVLSRFPHSFSGGQRQRIAIARALVTSPEFIVCDEPLSALDVSTQAKIIRLLNELRDKLDLTILFITHDLAVASELCDEVFVMQNGVIVESGPVTEVFANPQTAYTAKLIDAVPRIEAV